MSKSKKSGPKISGINFVRLVIDYKYQFISDYLGPVTPFVITVEHNKQKYAINGDIVGDTSYKCTKAHINRAQLDKLICQFQPGNVHIKDITAPTRQSCRDKIADILIQFVYSNFYVNPLLPENKFLQKQLA